MGGQLLNQVHSENVTEMSKILSPKSSTACLLVMAAIGITSRALGATFELPLDLRIETTGSRASEFDLEVSAFGFSDSEVSSLSGNVDATLTVEVANSALSVVGIQFAGGAINATDVSFRLPRIFTQAFIDGTDLAGTLQSIGSGSEVVAGKFPTEDHEILLNSGMLSISGNLVEDSMRSLEQDPINFIYPGEATIELAEIASIGLRKTFEARLSLPVDDLVDIEGQPATLTVSGQVNAKQPFDINFGDYNLDGLVTVLDYVAWRDAVGSGGFPLPADGTGDSVVDASDYELWQANYGQSASLRSANGSRPVPEPSALVYTSIALTLFYGRVLAGRMW